MRNRFENAIAIQDGAHNISGVGYSLIEACREASAAGVDPKVDSAVRLIIHQLAFVARVGVLQDVDAERAALTAAVMSGDPGVRRDAVEILGKRIPDAHTRDAALPDPMAVMSEKLVDSALAARVSGVQPAEDPAVRLILAWMADKADTKAIDNDLDTYGKLIQECREKNGLLNNRVFRVEAAGWDSQNPDDSRVLMVMAPSHKSVLDAIEGLNATCPNGEGLLGASFSFGGRIDFALPEKGGDFQARLAHLANHMPVDSESIDDMPAPAGT